jgi:hypothetical protein
VAIVNLVCGECGCSLGLYIAMWEAEGRSVQLQPLRLPNGFAELTKIGGDFEPGKEPLPKRYYMRQAGGLIRGRVNPMSYPKTRWRCGCGANPVYRDDALARRIPPGGGTVVV